jgi:hypothetical protein
MGPILQFGAFILFLEQFHKFTMYVYFTMWNVLIGSEKVFLFFIGLKTRSSENFGDELTPPS